MAELYADLEDDTTYPKWGQRLRLSIKWQSIRSVHPFPDEAKADLQIGLFLEDAPLFAEAVYGDSVRREKRGLPHGYFSAEDEDCRLLSELKETLDTGKRIEFEDNVEPIFKLIMGPDYLRDEVPSGPETSYYEVLTVMQWGGAWHGPALGSSGPAALICVTRDALQQFHADLLSEALNPDVCDETARSILIGRFSEDVKTSA